MSQSPERCKNTIFCISTINIGSILEEKANDSQDRKTSKDDGQEANGPPSLPSSLRARQRDHAADHQLEEDHVQESDKEVVHEDLFRESIELLGLSSVHAAAAGEDPGYSDYHSYHNNEEGIAGEAEVISIRMQM